MYHLFIPKRIKEQGEDELMNTYHSWTGINLIVEAVVCISF